MDRLIERKKIKIAKVPFCYISGLEGRGRGVVGFYKVARRAGVGTVGILCWWGHRMRRRREVRAGHWGLGWGSGPDVAWFGLA